MNRLDLDGLNDFLLFDLDGELPIHLFVSREVRQSQLTLPTNKLTALVFLQQALRCR
jgi:hypothetical protein